MNKTAQWTIITICWLFAATFNISTIIVFGFSALRGSVLCLQLAGFYFSAGYMVYYENQSPKAEKRTLKLRLFRPVMQYIGRLHGISGCLICGDSWAWKQAHYINVKIGRAFFPYCEECHENALPVQKKLAMDGIYYTWLRQGSVSAEDKMLYEHAIQLIKEGKA